MKNIQKQYTDLLEGKMSKQNFMRNVRMEFPQYVSNVSSYEDSVKILKGKRILSEVKIEELSPQTRRSAYDKASDLARVANNQFNQDPLEKQKRLGQMHKFGKSFDPGTELKIKNIIGRLDYDIELFRDSSSVRLKVTKQGKDVADVIVTKGKYDLQDPGEFDRSMGRKLMTAIKYIQDKELAESLNEAAKPEGVYGHNPNAETPPVPGIDQLNYYQVYRGIQYELAQMPEITDENYIKARKKVVATILKDPDAYKQLQLANFKAVKAMDEDLKMKEVKENNLTDKPNEMKVIKKDAKANTEDTLEKKEKKKAKNPKGVQVMTQTPKKAKGIAKVMEIPGKEKVKALKESIMQEMTRENPTYEHFQVGARVKKKDDSLVGEITEWDGDTATIKTDEGEMHHVQGNILTKGDVPTKEGTPTVNPKAHIPEDVEKVEESKEEREGKLKSLKEKLMKAVKELVKVNPTTKQAVSTTGNTDNQLATKLGYTQTLPGNLTALGKI